MPLPYSRSRERPGDLDPFALIVAALLAGAAASNQDAALAVRDAVQEEVSVRSVG